MESSKVVLSVKRKRQAEADAETDLNSNPDGNLSAAIDAMDEESASASTGENESEGEDSDTISRFVVDDEEESEGSTDGDYEEDSECESDCEEGGLSVDDNSQICYESSSESEEGEFEEDEEPKEELSELAIADEPPAKRTGIKRHTLEQPDADRDDGEQDETERAPQRPKRERKPVERYQDKGFAQAMLGDVPDDEMDAITDDRDEFFNRKVDPQGESESEDSVSSDGGYDTDTIAERDRISTRRPNAARTINHLFDNTQDIMQVDSPDSQDAPDSMGVIHCEGIAQFLVKKQCKESTPPQPVTKIALHSLMMPRLPLRTDPVKPEADPFKSVFLGMARKKPTGGNETL